MYTNQLCPAGCGSNIVVQPDDGIPPHIVHECTEVDYLPGGAGCQCATVCGGVE